MNFKETHFCSFLLLLQLQKYFAYDIFTSVYYPGLKNTFFEDDHFDIPKISKMSFRRELRTNYTGTYTGDAYTSTESNQNTIDFSENLSYETTSARSGKRITTIVEVVKPEVTKQFTQDIKYKSMKTSPRRTKRTRRNVYGRDDRSFIPITESLGLSEPYSYTVKISTGCTGIIVSPRHVLTAAHCVHDQKDYVSGTKGLKVGFFNANNTIDWVSVKTVKVSKGWIEGGVSNGPFYDYALLKLTKKHFKSYITLSISEQDHHGVGERISFTSFDDDKPKDTMWYRSCSIIEDDASFLYHYCDAKPGSSGSGVYTWVYDNDTQQWNRELVGVFSGNRWKIYDEFYIIVKNFNVAVRLTAARYAQICEWLGKYAKTVCKKRTKKLNNIVSRR